MNKVFPFIAVLLLIGIVCHGQKIYSLENLKQSTPENLETYLTFAEKQQKTGTIVLTTGLATAAAGFMLAAATLDRDEWIGVNTGTVIGGWMIILGTGAAMVGLPIKISGTTRIKRINKVISNNSACLPIELKPFCYHGEHSEQYIYGATVRIRF